MLALSHWPPRPDERDSAERRDVLLCAGVAAGVGAASLLALQVLVVAVALGTADFDRGTPGPAGGLGFGILTALAAAAACAAGAWAGARLLRWRHGSQRQSLLVGAWGAAAPVLLITALNVLLGDPRVLAVVLTTVATAAGSVVGARLGSSHDPSAR